MASTVDWETINPALITLITSLAVDSPEADPDTGKPAWSAEWRDRPLKNVGSDRKLQLTLKITNITQIGSDETRYEFDEESQEQVATQTGQRKLTLQLQALTTSHTDQLWALSALENVRSRLRRPSSIDALTAAGLAFIRAETVVDVPLKRDGRFFPGAVLDVVLGAVMNETDPGPSGWIQYVVISSAIEDTDGAELPAGMQWDEHEIPPIPPPPDPDP